MIEHVPGDPGRLGLVGSSPMASADGNHRQARGGNGRPRPAAAFYTDGTALRLPAWGARCVEDSIGNLWPARRRHLSLLQPYSHSGVVGFRGAGNGAPAGGSGVECSQHNRQRTGAGDRSRHGASAAGGHGG